MVYDFDALTNRRGTNSMKWDVPEQELPMWVADMDFETAPEIREALKKRVEHGIFGYTTVPDAWREAIIGWGEGEGLACILHRRSPCDFQCGQKADNGWGECAGADAGLQHLLQFHPEQWPQCAGKPSHV